MRQARQEALHPVLAATAQDRKEIDAKGARQLRGAAQQVQLVQKGQGQARPAQVVRQAAPPAAGGAFEKRRETYDVSLKRLAVAYIL